MSAHHSFVRWSSAELIRRHEIWAFPKAGLTCCAPVKATAHRPPCQPSFFKFLFFISTGHPQARQPPTTTHNHYHLHHRHHRRPHNDKIAAMTSPTTSPAPSASTSSMPPPPSPAPAAVPVFAPKPLRLPQNYLPQRSILLPQQQRTPSPRTSRSRSSSIASGVAEGEAADQMVRLYSPGPHESVLDDFLKLVRASHSTRPASPSTLRRSTTPQQARKEGEKMVIPASPVSRSLTRNPIIYNSQFGLVQEES